MESFGKSIVFVEKINGILKETHEILKEGNGILKKVDGVRTAIHRIPREINGIFGKIHGIPKEIHGARPRLGFQWNSLYVARVPPEDVNAIPCTLQG